MFIREKAQSTESIGDVGETVLTMLAQQAGVSVQRVTADRSGWDLLLEFPLDWPGPAAAPAGPFVQPLDLRPSPINCLVQAKATQSERRQWAIKLDNMLRLTKVPHPVFFSFVKLDASLDPVSLHLVPLGKDLITRTLHRVRKASADGKALRNLKLSIGFVRDEFEVGLSGNALAAAIQAHVGKIEDYLLWKSHLVESVGYESGVAEAEFGLALPQVASRTEFYDRLVDLALGELGPVKVTSSKYRDIRFNIPLEDAGRDFTGAELTAKPASPVTARLVVSRPDRQGQLETDVDLYWPALGEGVVPQEHIRTKLHGPMFEFVLWPYRPSQSQAKLSIPGMHDRCRLDHLKQFATLVGLFGRSYRLSEPLDVFAEVGGRTLFLGAMTPELEVQQDLAGLGAAIDDAWALASDHNLPSDSTTTLLDLYRQSGTLRMMRVLSDFPSVSARFKAVLGGPWKPESGDREQRVAFSISAAIGGRVLARIYVANVVTVDVVEDGQVDISLMGATTLSRHLYGPSDDHRADLHKRLADYAAGLPDSMDLFVLYP